MSDNAKAIAWTNVVTKNGYVISITSRDGAPVQESYMAIIDFLSTHEHLTPFVSYQNKYVDYDSQTVEREAEEKGLVEEAKSLGGVEKTQLEDGTNYLGLKKYKPKAADVVANDSYEIMTNSYSNDGQEIKFYGSEGQYPVASHKLTGTWGETFAKIFNGWQPKEGSKIPLKEPVKLYIVCSGKKSTGNPYHNVKEVNR